MKEFLEKIKIKVEVFSKQGSVMAEKYFPQGGGEHSKTIMIDTPLVGHKFFVSYREDIDCALVTIYSTTNAMFLVNKLIALDYLKHWEQTGFNISKGGIEDLSLVAYKDKEHFPEEVLDVCFKIERGREYITGCI